MRGINTRFIEDLQFGCLSSFLEAVKMNDKLWIGIRKDYINIYYCGGNAVRIKQKVSGYEMFFDIRYCDNKPQSRYRERLASIDYKDSEQVSVAMPMMLTEMDSWFAAHPKPERSFQHSLLKNNPGILDIEYAGKTSHGKGFRLDMLAVMDGSLTIVENKYGNSAIGGKAGLAKHYNDILSILIDPPLRQELIQSAKNIASNKAMLGLPNMRFINEQVEILLLLVDYNEKGKILENELSKMSGSVPSKLLLMDSLGKGIDMLKARKI